MSEVKVYLDELTIPTYRIGPPNPNPVILGYRGFKPYPYIIRDELTEIREDVAYKALILENEYLKVTVLPELGGRLYSAFDKRNSREFFYRNHVIKPQLVGLTGAWFAGGIEWNFPRGHRPSTMEPIEACCRGSEDGSASIFVGEIDKISGLRFSVEIRLQPGKAFIEETVAIHNPTDLPARYMFWSTSAEYETPDLELRYPMKWMIDEHNRKKYPWPFDRETGRHDLRWTKNTYGPTTIFGANVTKDYFGTYDRSQDCGAVHIANYREVPGKKMWAWGMDRFGRRWNELLTDDDGPYVELQSGNPDNQQEFLVLEPHAGRTWKEYWFQAIETGPFTHAGLYGAMAWRIAGDRDGFTLDFKLRPNEDLPGCTVRLLHGAEQVYSGRFDLDPTRTTSFQAKIGLEAMTAGTLRIILEDRHGLQLMAETIRQTADALADISTPPVKEEDEPQGSLFHQAFQHEMFDRRREALALYDEVIAANADHTAAYLRKAIIHLKMLDHGQAIRSLEAALVKEPHHNEALYYLGLACFRAGQRQKAKDALYYVSPSSIHYGASALLLAVILLGEQDYQQAEQHLRSALAANPGDYMALIYLAYALRKQGMCVPAESLLEELLVRDPLNFLAQRERLFNLAEQGKNAEQAIEEYRRTTRNDAHSILAVAALYQSVGDYAAALQVVEDDIQGVHPLLSYHAGFYYQNLAQPQRAEALWRQAEEAAPDFVFPNHPDTAAVLGEVIERFGDKAVKARYFLGLIYQTRELYEETVRLWQDCLRLGMRYSVLNRSLGYIQWKIMGDQDKARVVLEEALAYEPANPEIFVYLNQIYRERGETEKRRRLMEIVEGSASLTQTAARTLLNMYNDFGRWEEAIRLFEDFGFRIWEHDENPVLNLTYLGAMAYGGRATAHIQAGRYREAIADLTRGLEIAERDKDLWTKTLYSLGVCHEQVGAFGEALACYRRITLETPTPGSKAHDYFLKAAGKMLDLEWAGVE